MEIMQLPTFVAIVYEYYYSRFVPYIRPIDAKCERVQCTQFHSLLRERELPTKNRWKVKKWKFLLKMSRDLSLARQYRKTAVGEKNQNHLNLSKLFFCFIFVLFSLHFSHRRRPHTSESFAESSSELAVINGEINQYFFNYPARSLRTQEWEESAKKITSGRNEIKIKYDCEMEPMS